MTGFILFLFIAALILTVERERKKEIEMRKKNE